jgi:hypothetical protein
VPQINLKISVNIDPLQKIFKFNIGGKEHNVSKEIPENVWNILNKEVSSSSPEYEIMMTEVMETINNYFKRHIYRKF